MSGVEAWTNTELLDALRGDEDPAAWAALDQRIRPIVHGFARRLGVPDQDAADVAQETMMRMVKAYRDGGYERSRGGLRAWVVGIARHRVLDWRQRAAGRGAEESVSSLPDPADWDSRFEDEWRAHILALAFRELREHGGLAEHRVRAFEMTAREGRPIADAAAALGMSENAVYMARHECLRRLRALASELERRFEGD